jgi:DNA-binding transcriptional LysR family regulator
MHTMLSLVAGGLGVTVVPESVSHADRKGVVYVEILDVTPPVETAVAYLKSNKSTILANFLRILRTVSANRFGNE